MVWSPSHLPGSYQDVPTPPWAGFAPAALTCLSRHTHRRESTAHQQGPAEMIGHGQGIAVLSIARLELPFEIGGPHLIRVVSLHRDCARMGPRATAPILSEQFVALEDVVQSTACRPGPHRMSIAEDPQQFLGPPAVLLARLDDQRLGGVARPVRAPMRGTAAVPSPRGRSHDGAPA